MNNAAKIQKRFSRLTSGVSDERYAIIAMRKVANALSSYIESGAAIPVDTHNLKDSTGIALYSPGGVLRTYIPTKKASAPKRTTGLRGVSTEPKWGTYELARMIEYGSSKYNNGYYLVVFSAMPYAGIVNTITSPYFGRIKALAVMEIKDIMRIYKNITANPV